MILKQKGYVYYQKSNNYDWPKILFNLNYFIIEQLARFKFYTEI